MQFLTYLFNRFGFFFLFLFLEVISLFLILNNKGYHSSVAAEWNTAITGFIYNYKSKVEYIAIAPKEVKKLQEENKNLREQLLLKKTDLIKVLSGERIDTLQGSVIQNYELIAAQVISNSLNKRNNYITINKGKNDGLEPDMGVISDNGVIGTIRNVSDNYARITSLLNPDQIVNARVKGLDYFGILNWRESGRGIRKLKLYQIPKYLKVEKGDTVETEGSSHFFPEGINIGIIDSVGFDKVSGNLDLDVLINEDFGRLTTVYIVKNLNRKELDSLESQEK